MRRRALSTGCTSVQIRCIISIELSESDVCIGRLNQTTSVKTSQEAVRVRVVYPTQVTLQWKHDRPDGLPTRRRQSELCAVKNQLIGTIIVKRPYSYTA